MNNKYINQLKVFFVLLSVFLLLGCAGKKENKMIIKESSIVDCGSIDQELIDARTLLSSLKKFEPLGIGNGMARNDLVEKATKRINDLEKSKRYECK